MSVYEQVKQALQDVVAPGLKAIEVEIKRLDEKIDSIKTEMSTEFKRVDERTGSLKTEITTEIKRLDEKIDIALRELTQRPLSGASASLRGFFIGKNIFYRLIAKKTAWRERQDTAASTPISRSISELQRLFERHATEARQAIVVCRDRADCPCDVCVQVADSRNREKWQAMRTAKRENLSKFLKTCGVPKPPVSRNLRGNKSSTSKGTERLLSVINQKQSCDGKGAAVVSLRARQIRYLAYPGQKNSVWYG